MNESPDKSNAFIEKLSRVYRYLLDVKGEDLVPLQRELHFARSYLDLQAVRLGDKVQVIMQVAHPEPYTLPPPVAAAAPGKCL